jgi:hypothetical protein
MAGGQRAKRKVDCSALATSLKFLFADDSPGTFDHCIPSPSGRQAGELEATSCGIMNDGR